MLGEALYPLVSRYQPVLARKITGMLLCLDNNEILGILDNDLRLLGYCNHAVITINSMAVSKNDLSDL